MKTSVKWILSFFQPSISSRISPGLKPNVSIWRSSIITYPRCNRSFPRCNQWKSQWLRIIMFKHVWMYGEHVQIYLYSCSDHTSNMFKRITIDVFMFNHRSIQRESEVYNENQLSLKAISYSIRWKNIEVKPASIYKETNDDIKESLMDYFIWKYGHSELIIHDFWACISRNDRCWNLHRYIAQENISQACNEINGSLTLASDILHKMEFSTCSM